MVVTRAEKRRRRYGIHPGCAAGPAVFQRRARFDVVKTPTPLFELLDIFNAADPRLCGRSCVRRAFVMSLDRAEIVSKATLGAEDTAHMPDRGLFRWAYDPRVPPVPLRSRSGAAAARRRRLEARNGRRAREERPPPRTELSAILSGTPIFATEALEVASQAARCWHPGKHLGRISTQQYVLLTNQGVLWGGKFQVALDGVRRCGTTRIPTG